MASKGNDLELPSVVISHSSKDRDLALRLADAFEGQPFDIWIASRDIPIGTNFAEEISRAISHADFLIVLLSKSSLTSPHVKREVNMAIDKGVTLLPVALPDESDFVETLPDDWTYWLGLAQVVNFTDEASTARQISHQILKKINNNQLTAKNDINKQVDESVNVAPEVFVKPNVEVPNIQSPKLPPKIEPAQKTERVTKVNNFPKIELSKSGVKKVGIAACIAALIGIAFLFLPSSKPATGITAQAKSQNSSSPKIQAAKNKIFSPSPISKNSSSTLVKSSAPSQSPSQIPKASSSPSATSSAMTKTATKSSSRPSTTASTSSAKPSPKATASASKSSPKPTVVHSSLQINKALLSQAATASVKRCLGTWGGPKKSGCPFSEKNASRARSFQWALVQGVNLINWSGSNGHYVGKISFTVSDEISYGSSSGHSRKQMVFAKSVFVQKGNSIVATLTQTSSKTIY